MAVFFKQLFITKSKLLFMKIFKFLLVLGGFVFITSCGGDDCVQADWIGTFTLDESTVSETCDNLGVFPATLVIAADSTDGITINGERFTSLDDCEVGFSAFGSGEKYTLDGSSIEYLNIACTATYNK